MLFTSDEAYNGDALSKHLPADKSAEEELRNTMKESSMARTIDLNCLEPETRDKLTERNMWKACIQRNLQNITKDLLVVDTEKNYSVDPREMMKVLDRRLKITQPMQQNKGELHDYLCEFRDEKTGLINYQQMAMDLRGFNFDNETNLGVLPKSSRSISSGRYSFVGSFVNKNAFTDDLCVLNSQSVPANQLDKIERHFIRVNRHLQDKFGTPENLETFLREKIDADHSGNIDVNEMKNLIKETCAEQVQ